MTGDALLVLRELCKQIVEQGREYLFIVKANQPTLMRDIAVLFDDPPVRPAEVVQRSRHGDREGVRKGETTVKAAYALTNLWPHEAGPKCLLELNRDHRRIENRPHHVRDVTLGEDASQVRTGSAAQVMAVLHNATMGLLPMEGTNNIGAAFAGTLSTPRRPWPYWR